MRRFSLAVVVALTISTQVVAQVRVIRAKSEGEASQPVFIAASEMFIEGRFSAAVPEFWRDIIRQDVDFSRSQRNLQVDASKAAGEPCGGVYLGEADIESSVIRDSAESTTENASAIILGRIRTVTPGFFQASPGSLLELDELTQIKSSVAFRHVEDRLYVRHPYANFQAGGSAYCRETRRGENVPKVGDHVLVFAFGDPFDDSGTFIYSHLNDLIVESATTGRLHVPDLLEVVASDANDVEAVVAKVRKLLQRSREVPERRGRQ